MRVSDFKGVDRSMLFEDLIAGNRQAVAIERSARDQAMAENIAADPSWHANTLDSIATLTGFEGIFEDIRTSMEGNGWPAPHTPNCWGTVALAAERKGYLVPTGEMRHMKRKGSHARTSKVVRSAS